jgi:hypothetical protein
VFFSKNRFKVKTVANYAISYIEGKHKALIESEFLVGEIDLVVYFDTLKSWEPPFENEIISDESKVTIRENIANELKRQKISFEWG